MAWSAYRLRARLNLVKGTMDYLLNVAFGFIVGGLAPLAAIGLAGWAVHRWGASDEETAFVVFGLFVLLGAVAFSL